MTYKNFKRIFGELYWDKILPSKQEKTMDTGRKYFLQSFIEEFVFIVKRLGESSVCIAFNPLKLRIQIFFL